MKRKSEQKVVSLPAKAPKTQKDPNQKIKPKSAADKPSKFAKPTKNGDIKKNASSKPGFKAKGNFVKKFGDNKKGPTKTDDQKPPDWVKFKKDKKLVRVARRQAGIDSEVVKVIQQAKSISEKLRRKKGTPEDRLKLTDELHKLLKPKGYYKQLAMAHDTSRIIQWLLKFGSIQIREEASMILVDMVVEMLQSKYARNSVKRILKYGSPAIRDAVLKSIQGSVLKLACHKMSAAILDYAFSEVASKKQKQYLQQEFYGDMYKNNKDDSLTKLRDTFKDNPEMKSAILGATKANLLKVLNKDVHDCGLVHAVLNDYLRECNSNDRSEMITTLSPMVAPLSNSKAGAKAAMMCVWHGSSKDKKVILKVLKEHAVSLATHEHGHLLILSVLSGVDDTVLVNKVLLSTLLKDVKSVASTEWGRKIILWLVAPGDKAYFHPALVDWLNKECSEGTSKKPAEQKASELSKDVLPILCKSFEEETEFWLSTASSSLAAMAILKSAGGESLQTVLDALSKYICQDNWKIMDGDKEVNGIEHSGLHICLKKLAQHDKINNEKQELTFGDSLLKVLKAETVQLWIETNRGCFLLITIFENNGSEVKDKIKLLLKPHVKLLKKQTTAGAKILLKHIS